MNLVAVPSVLSAIRARDLQSRLGHLGPDEILSAAIGAVFSGRIAVVSSFGAESAVLLHLVAEIDRTIPVLFIDTGRHFAETLHYRNRLADHLGLIDVRNVGPTEAEVTRFDADMSRATWDPDGCCAFRKTAPLQHALKSFDAWISGRKRFQAETRSGLVAFESNDDHVKINPLASWTASDLAAYAARHGLPAHPLVGQGYASIGCAPCTTTVRPGEDPRAGRWRGLDKIECGIHGPRQAPGREL